MHQGLIKLWFRDILNWLDMIKSVTSTRCIRGKEKSTMRGAYSMEATGAEKGMFSEAEYNPVGSYIKYFDLDKSMWEKKNPYLLRRCRRSDVSVAEWSVYRLCRR